MLWMAPEILRNIDSNVIAGKEADVYSFSIVCSEIITKHPPFAFNNDGNEQLPGLILKCVTCLFDFTDIIHLIKKESSPAFRPQLNVNDTADINPAMVLFRDISTKIQQRIFIDTIN
jgi:serine/threonine protein kinase